MNVYTMLSNDFQRMCRDMLNISDRYNHITRSFKDKLYWILKPKKQL